MNVYIYNITVTNFKKRKYILLMKMLLSLNVIASVISENPSSMVSNAVVSNKNNTAKLIVDNTGMVDTIELKVDTVYLCSYFLK